MYNVHGLDEYDWLKLKLLRPVQIYVCVHFIGHIGYMGTRTVCAVHVYCTVLYNVQHMIVPVQCTQYTVHSKIKRDSRIKNRNKRSMKKIEVWVIFLNGFTSHCEKKSVGQANEKKEASPNNECTCHNRRN